jgi:hypothetical protein
MYKLSDFGTNFADLNSEMGVLPGDLNCQVNYIL